MAVFHLRWFLQLGIESEPFPRRMTLVEELCLSARKVKNDGDNRETEKLKKKKKY